MTAAEDYEHLKRLLDKLPPAKLRHLRAITDTDPELAGWRVEEQPTAAELPGFAAFVGMGRSGHRDTARRHRELVQEWSDEDR